MEKETVDLIAEIVRMSINFSLSNPLVGFTWFAITFMACMFTFVLMCIAWRKCPAEENPPEVSEGLNVWTVDRNSLWVRYYHLYWGMFPRDICSYFLKSLLATVMGILWIPLAIIMVTSVLSILCWIVYGLWYVGWYYLPLVIPHLPEIPGFFLWAIVLMFTGMGRDIYHFVTHPLGYGVMVLAGVIVFIMIFCESNAYQATRLWIKAKKERSCRRIRVV